LLIDIISYIYLINIHQRKLILFFSFVKKSYYN